LTKRDLFTVLLKYITLNSLDKNFTTKANIEDCLNEELANVTGQLVEHNSKGFSYKYNQAREIEQSKNYANFKSQYEKNFSRELETVIFLPLIGNLEFQ
jgi:hypothetical protein